MLENLDTTLLELFNGSNSSFIDGLMLVMTSGYTWIPLYVALLYLVVNNSETMSQICLIVGCALLCIVFSGGICDYVVKPLVARVRPLNDVALHNIVIHVYGVSAKDFSFFSSHAANTFSITVFFSLLVRNSKFFVALLIWSLLNCYTRLYLGVHYPSDIFVGILWGGLVGLIVYCLYYKLYSRFFTGGEYISSQYTSKGYTIYSVDIVILVLTFLYIYAIIRALTFSY